MSGLSDRRRRNGVLGRQQQPRAGAWWGCVPRWLALVVGPGWLPGTPIATVSTPLIWEELADADPDGYTIATAPDRVARRDEPWADIDSNAHSIEPLLDVVKARIGFRNR